MPRLRRSDLSSRGFRRRRSGGGFRYTDDGGSSLSESDRERIAALAIPPAWTDVWIAPHANGHVQATGVDEAGRRQYIYHSDWRTKKDKTKFERALKLAAVIPAARAAVTKDLRGNDERLRVLAAAFRLLDAGSLRVGSQRYAESNGSRGLSTLLCSHVSLTGDRITLRFPGKSGKVWHSEFDDADLAAVLAPLIKRGPKARVLAVKDDDDWRPLSSNDINDYVRDRTGGDFTSKDFRTLRGTAAAAASLAEHGPAASKTERKAAVAESMRAAARVLGNTPAIAKKSYVDPRVVARFRAGETINPAHALEGELLRLLG
jgi:DNA topoisomerase I